MEEARMKKKAVRIVQIVVNLLLAPLFFMKWIVDVGYLPDQNGNVIEKRYYYSPTENLTDIGLGWLTHVCLALLFCSVFLSAFSLAKSENRVFRKISLILSVVSFVCVSFVLFYAATAVSRGY